MNITTSNFIDDNFRKKAIKIVINSIIKKLILIENVVLIKDIYLLIGTYMAQLYTIICNNIIERMELFGIYYRCKNPSMEKIIKVALNNQTKKFNNADNENNIKKLNIIFENLKITFVRFCKYQYQYCDRCLQSVDMTNLETYSNLHDSMHKVRPLAYENKCNNCNYTCAESNCNCGIKTFFSKKDTIICTI
jgi:hypothetical protein